MASVTFSVTPLEDDPPPPCASCGTPAQVEMVLDGVNHEPAPCCGNPRCQFVIAMQLATDEE